MIGVIDIDVVGDSEFEGMELGALAEVEDQILDHAEALAGLGATTTNHKRERRLEQQLRKVKAAQKKKLAQLRKQQTSRVNAALDATTAAIAERDQLIAANKEQDIYGQAYMDVLAQQGQDGGYGAGGYDDLFGDTSASLYDPNYNLGPGARDFGDFGPPDFGDDSGGLDFGDEPVFQSEGLGALGFIPLIAAAAGAAIDFWKKRSDQKDADKAAKEAAAKEAQDRTREAMKLAKVSRFTAPGSGPSGKKGKGLGPVAIGLAVVALAVAAKKRGRR